MNPLPAYALLDGPEPAFDVVTVLLVPVAAEHETLSGVRAPGDGEPSRLGGMRSLMASKPLASAKVHTSL